MAHRFEDKMKADSSVTLGLLSLVISCLLWINIADASEWQAELAETENMITQAKTVGGLWRDTEKLLKKAKQLQTNGNLNEAKTLLLTAKQQAKLGHQQATSQLNNFVVPYYLQH